MNTKLPERAAMLSERAFFCSEEGSIVLLIQVLDELTLVVELNADLPYSVSFLSGRIDELALRMKLVKLRSNDVSIAFLIEALEDHLMRFTIERFVSSTKQKKSRTPFEKASCGLTESVTFIGPRKLEAAL